MDLIEDDKINYCANSKEKELTSDWRKKKRIVNRAAFDICLQKLDSILRQK